MVTINCLLCKKPGELKVNRKDKLFIRCDYCGLLAFVNKKYGQDLLASIAADEKHGT